MTEKDYQIASITKDEEAAIKKAEAEVKKETGKDFVMVAWEKE
ncbi:hypothetical protein [Terrisporobacter mayombei]|uniref:Uncharacterized protein n=1 Tax=Terrisporobacter mayombei TaxID=1541 RepID=A0ABY9PYW2_9FIRM|nr:hypothetical protein [Terrisporobacter mayombei]WMT79945.1 hypothetical protein TEMA_02160 [Terrisporobacter mayombei]